MVPLPSSQFHGKPCFDLESCFCCSFFFVRVSIKFLSVLRVVAPAQTNGALSPCRWCAGVSEHGTQLAGEGEVSGVCQDARILQQPPSFELLHFCTFFLVSWQSYYGA